MLNSHVVKHRCYLCTKKVVTRPYHKIFDTSTHYILCKQCKSGTKFISKTKCFKHYLLDIEDISKIKYLYIPNPNNGAMLYLPTDVEKLVVEKFGSITRFNSLLESKEKNKSDKQDKLDKKIKERRLELEKKLNDNKLQLKNFGDCYSYINYGYPPIDTVVEKELEKLSVQNSRREILGEYLEKKGLMIDESLVSCYNYIHNVGCKNLEDSVRAVEIEYFFKYHTEYSTLIKQHCESEAKDIALKKYIEKNSTTDILHSKIVVNFN